MSGWCSATEAAVDAAIAGVGLTRVFSYQVEAAVKARALAVALKKFEPVPTPISIVSTGQRLLPLKVRAFLDFATPRLRARLLGTAHISNTEAAINAR